jgi:hypothetical protein
MTQKSKNWTAGEGVTIDELQVTATAAASADDAASALFLSPTPTATAAYDKGVLPLRFDLDARLLVTAATPNVSIGPATYRVGQNNIDLTAAPDLAQSVKVAESTTIDAALLPSGTTHGRIDVVYALVQQEAVIANRKIKDPSTGVKTTQSVTAYKNPTVTFAVQRGSESTTPAIPSLPADSSTAWYFPLAQIALDNGSTGPWTEGNSLAQSRITQLWQGAWIAPQRVRRHVPASIMATTYSSGSNGVANITLGSRFGSMITRCAVVQHKTSSATPVVLDTSVNYQYRFINIRAVLLSSGVNHDVPGTETTSGGSTATSGTAYIGNGAFAGIWAPTISTATPAFMADNSGGTPVPLTVIFNYSPISTGNPNVWYFEWDLTDPFVF